MQTRPFEKSYVNDFDGNIVNAPTPFYLKKKQSDGSWEVVEVPAHDYDASPQKYHDTDNYQFMDISYQNFSDFGSDLRHQGPDRFLRDILYALENHGLAPSFETFKQEVLIGAELFAILTARANGSENLKRGIQSINKESLTKEEKEQQIENIKKKYNKEKLSDKAALQRYFDINCYFPVNNIEFQKYIGMPKNLSSSEKKAWTMDWYIRYIADIIAQYQVIDEQTKVSLGFSDDSLENIKAMINYFSTKYRSIQAPYNYFNYNIYYTGKDSVAFDRVTERLESGIYVMPKDNPVNKDHPIQKIEFIA
jgi:hypothetical protein